MVLENKKERNDVFTKFKVKIIGKLNIISIETKINYFLSKL
ncbi:hypothetical protein GM3709_476 [Geminocystis sp. NIES-3709]|nr:hypothetical protein GM3709_476 [Geminocystis sp. NIES-3709]